MTPPRVVPKRIFRRSSANARFRNQTLQQKKLRFLLIFGHLGENFSSASLLKEYVNEMESVESSLKQMGENVSAVQGTAVPGLDSWGQDKLDKCQDRWGSLSKKV